MAKFVISPCTLPEGVAAADERGSSAAVTRRALRRVTRRMKGYRIHILGWFYGMHRRWFPEVMLHPSGYGCRQFYAIGARWTACQVGQQIMAFARTRRERTSDRVPAQHLHNMPHVTTSVLSVAR